MKINNYEFGRIEINNKIYESDVIIFPNHVIDNWWRKEGHRLDIDDLNEIIERGVDILIIGTGANGLMDVPEEVVESLRSRGIEVIVEKTGTACERYNEISEKEVGKKVVAALHLTC